VVIPGAAEAVTPTPPAVVWSPWFVAPAQTSPEAVVDAARESSVTASAE